MHCPASEKKRWFRFLFPAVLLTLILLPFSPNARAQGAPPLDSNSKIRLDRAKDALKNERIKEDLRRNVPFDRAASVKTEHSRIEYAVGTAQNEMGMVKNKRHPEVVAFAAELAKFEAYLADLKAVMKDHELNGKAAAALRGKFFSKYWDEHGVLTNYYYYMDPSQKGMPYGTQKELAAAREALKRIHEGCTGEFKAVVNDATSHPNGRTRRPDLMCKAAAMGEELVRRVVVAMAKLILDEVVTGFKEQLAAMPTDDGRLKKMNKDYFYEPETLKKTIAERYQSDLKFVGVELDSKMFTDLFAEVETARAALLAEIPKHLSRWKGGQHGRKKSDSFVEKAYKNAHKGVKILLLEMRDDAWVVEVNSLGVPKFRKKRGGVVFKLPDEAWCHDEEFAYFQDYQGHKSYGKSYFEFAPAKLRHSAIVSCP
ncbi:hypothetical protein KKC22_10980 [Myxococcota bacterium]|nr:hypothetical protein [Myxococcota bacterium]